MVPGKNQNLASEKEQKLGLLNIKQECQALNCYAWSEE
jgi:hypothetical protein